MEEWIEADLSLCGNQSKQIDIQAWEALDSSARPTCAQTDRLLCRRDQTLRVTVSRVRRRHQNERR